MYKEFSERKEAPFALNMIEVRALKNDKESLKRKIDYMFKLQNYEKKYGLPGRSLDNYLETLIDQT